MVDLKMRSILLVGFYLVMIRGMAAGMELVGEDFDLSRVDEVSTR